MAVKWFRLSAQAGDHYAQNNLGLMYYDGNGVAQDYVKAHMWFNIAAMENTNKDSGKFRDDVSLKLTAEQISQAQALATRCVQESFNNCD
jgi:TPR repeat protein